jgi:hypothetical protein
LLVWIAHRAIGILCSGVFCSVAVLPSAPFKARHNLPSLNQISVIGVKSVQWSD